jgi:hypothetical protein
VVMNAESMNDEKRTGKLKHYLIDKFPSEISLIDTARSEKLMG